MGRLIDLTGRRFGRLTVICRGKTKKHPAGGTIVYWLCKCDCGNEVEVVGGDLRGGKTLSCGCYQRKRSKEYHTKHNMANKRIYHIWQGMKKRCENPRFKHYHYYGGRGIKVCEEWQSFEVFYEWAMANGYADNLTIDRIDNNGNYCPENCRWATWKEQSNNTSKNHLITYNGETHTIREWSDITGISYSALTTRVLRGWDIERMFNQPVRGRAK